MRHTNPSPTPAFSKVDKMFNDKINGIIELRLLHFKQIRDEMLNFLRWLSIINSIIRKTAKTYSMNFSKDALPLCKRFHFVGEDILDCIYRSELWNLLKVNVKLKSTQCHVYPSNHAIQRDYVKTYVVIKIININSPGYFIMRIISYD